MKSMRTLLVAWVAFVLPVLILLAWEFAAARDWLPTNALPAPSAILATLADLARRGELIDHLTATTMRVAVGFGLGVAAATVLGALCGTLPLARRLLDPLIHGLKAVPSLAWVPLFILWFGIFETSKVLLIAVGIFFPVYLALAAGISYLFGEGQRYEVAAFGRNLLDEDYLTYAFPLAGFGLNEQMWGRPRSWGLEATVKF